LKYADCFNLDGIVVTKRLIFLEGFMYAHLSKAELTKFSKLSNRRYREEMGLFLAEGLRVVEQIIRRGLIDVEMVIVELGREPVLDEVFGVGRGRKWFEGEVRVAAADMMGRLAQTEHSQGVIAVCRVPEPVDLRDLLGGYLGSGWGVGRDKDSGADIDEGVGVKVGAGGIAGFDAFVERNFGSGFGEGEQRRVLLALDRIQDPGNMGALYRSAAWFGVLGLLAGVGTVDLYNPKVVRSTAGALGSVPIVKGELPDLLDELVKAGWQVVVMDAGGEGLECGAALWSSKVVLVVGNEANGIDSEILKRAGKTIAIQGNSDNVESLNVVVAASIGLFALYN